MSEIVTSFSLNFLYNKDIGYIYPNNVQKLKVHVCNLE